MTQRLLHLASTLTLPLETVTQTIAVLAKRRAGKSYTMRRLVEQLFKAGQQVVLVDPKGDQWGVRSAADGKGPGLPIVILGGERGDIPLEPSGGEVVAKLVVEERVSILLDVSLFRKHEVATFMTAFLENLYRLKAREIYRTPLMLVIDEADAIAPQKPQKGEERMLGAAEDIVRRGGQRGIGCVLVSQRSAVLNKNVLTQAQMLVALRTIAPQDLAALDAWIDVHGTPAERKALMESLPSLPVGDAWFWSPGWPTTDGIFKRVHVLPIETFDSGATPKPGEKHVEPKKPADVDLEALKRQMSATIEKAKAEDPRELRKQIAELKKALAAKSSVAGPKETVLRVDVPVLKDSQITRLEKIYTRMLEKADDYGKSMVLLWEQQSEEAKALLGVLRIVTNVPKAEATVHPFRKPASHAPTAPASVRRAEPGRSQGGRRQPTSPAGDGSINRGERAILTAAAQYPDGVTREQLTVLTGYKRSSRDTYLQRLLQAGLVHANRSGSLKATDAGIATLGDFEPLPTGDALLQYWLQRLPAGEARLLSVLAEAYPKAVDRETLSTSTDYKRSSRDTYLQHLSARQLIRIERDGVTASAELFS